MRQAGIFAGLVFLGTACASDGPAAPSEPAASTRSFAMGLSDFPHAFSTAALAFATEAVYRDADLTMINHDDGVPWEEAASGAPYPAAYQADLERRARAQPPGHRRYLAVTPVNFLRDGLADRRGPIGSEPLRSPWSTRRFDDPETIAAYLAHCERLIAIFNPDHFVYGIEVNVLAWKRPELWPPLVRLLNSVYAEVKARHPALTVSLTFQVDFLRAFPQPQEPLVREVLPLTDMVGASTYPYEQQSDPLRLPADFFDRLAALGAGSGKSFFIAETGWPAESVTSPYPKFIDASEEGQRRYVEWLLGQAERHRAVLVNWIFARDYDDLWASHLESAPQAALLRLWKDIGLYRGDGTARPARDSWRAGLARRRQ